MIRRVSTAAATLALAFALGLTAISSSLAVKPKVIPKLKLPAERTSPTGNFFTLEAYHAPSSSTQVAQFEMKVCTSAHTPSYTAIDPLFFSLKLAKGGSVIDSPAAASSPALVQKPLKKLQCVEGWLGFPVPKGQTVSQLEYAYSGKISWDVSHGTD